MDTSHALVIGGTGMLRDATLDLARQGYAVTAIARRQARLDSLAADAPDRIFPIALDYRDTVALAAAVESAVAERGPVTLAVTWIHSTAPDAPLAVANTLSGAGVPFHYYDVLGSASADPSRLRPDEAALFQQLPGLTYHEVILGFVLLPSGRSRWLTNEEISGGLLEAIASGTARHIVGTVEPWSRRP